MTRFKNNPESEDKTAPYATSDDFRHVFTDSLHSLYQLSFLLTGDHEIAEHCFVTGLEDSIGANHVFKEWAHAWAKRTIVQQAIRALHPKPRSYADSAEVSAACGDLRNVPDRQGVIDRLFLLDRFDRFVFVMSVLERYSERDCALLLGCSPPDVRDARMRALQQITVGRPPRTDEHVLADEVIGGLGSSHHV